MHRVTSTVTRKGQVTVPAEVRRALGIRVGDKVTFILDGDSARIERRTSVVDRTAGIFRTNEPPRSAEDLRGAAEQAVADEVVGRS